MRKPVPLSRLQSPNVMRLSDFMPEMDGAEDEAIDAKTNVENRDLVVANWQLGPEKASPDPKANAPYWRQMAATWNITEAEARRRVCANCEYYDNTPARMAEMEAVPLDVFDMDGGGRGFCVKFDFICHSLRVCQAWEEKPFEEAED